MEQRNESEGQFQVTASDVPEAGANVTGLPMSLTASVLTLFGFPLSKEGHFAVRVTPNAQAAQPSFLIEVLLTDSRVSGVCLTIEGNPSRMLEVFEDEPIADASVLDELIETIQRISHSIVKGEQRYRLEVIGVEGVDATPAVFRVNPDVLTQEEMHA